VQEVLHGRQWSPGRKNLLFPGITKLLQGGIIQFFGQGSGKPRLGCLLHVLVHRGMGDATVYGDLPVAAMLFKLQP